MEVMFVETFYTEESLENGDHAKMDTEAGISLTLREIFTLIRQEYHGGTAWIVGGHSMVFTKSLSVMQHGHMPVFKNQSDNLIAIDKELIIDITKNKLTESTVNRIFRLFKPYLCH